MLRLRTNGHGRYIIMFECKKTIPAEHEANIFGSCDAYLKKMERALGVDITEHNGELNIAGSEEGVRRAESSIESLLGLSRQNGSISEQQVDYVIALSMEGEGREKEVAEIDRDIICRTISGRPVKPKTLGQKQYVDAIRTKMITFGTGPAGTGKTYLAMALAIKAFKEQEVQRIILTRPAIEAGEKLGFLPGDLQQKIDPYLRPLYDALYGIMGADSFIANQEKGLIEVAPLAYMRGRTLDNAFIILDEAQNTTPAQMKMFLTRIGFGSKVVVTGDLTQKDLDKDQASGLETAIKVLNRIDDIGFVELTANDVVRHPLVQKIVMAYDAYEAKLNDRKHRK